MEGKPEFDEIWEDIKVLMDGMMVMVKDLARSKGFDPDELLEVNKSSSSPIFQALSSIPVACESSIFPPLEARVLVSDGYGQPSPFKLESLEAARKILDEMINPAMTNSVKDNSLVDSKSNEPSPLKLEGPKAAHNLFDKMPQLTSADGNEGKPNRFPTVVPDNDGIDIVGTIGWVGDIVLDPWIESETKHSIVEEIPSRSLANAIEETYVDDGSTKEGTTIKLVAWGQHEVVEEANQPFSWKLVSLKTTHHLSSKMPMPRPILVFGIDGGMISSLNNYNLILVKAEVSFSDPYYHTKNNLIYVAFGGCENDVSLIDNDALFLFDPGGCTLSLMSCDPFEFIGEQRDFYSVTNVVEFITFTDMIKNASSCDVIVQNHGTSDSASCLLFDVMPLATFMTNILATVTNTYLIGNDHNRRPQMGLNGHHTIGVSVYYLFDPGGSSCGSHLQITRLSYSGTYGVNSTIWVGNALQFSSLSGMIPWSSVDPVCATKGLLFSILVFINSLHLHGNVHMHSTIINMRKKCGNGTYVAIIKSSSNRDVECFSTTWMSLSNRSHCGNVAELFGMMISNNIGSQEVGLLPTLWTLSMCLSSCLFCCVLVYYSTEISRFKSLRWKLKFRFIWEAFNDIASFPDLQHKLSHQAAVFGTVTLVGEDYLKCVPHHLLTGIEIKFHEENNIDFSFIYRDVAVPASLLYEWSRYARFCLATVTQVHTKYTLKRETQHWSNKWESDLELASTEKDLTLKSVSLTLQILFTKLQYSDTSFATNFVGRLVIIDVGTNNGDLRKLHGRTFSKEDLEIMASLEFDVVGLFWMIICNGPRAEETRGLFASLYYYDLEVMMSSSDTMLSVLGSSSVAYKVFEIEKCNQIALSELASQLQMVPTDVSMDNEDVVKFNGATTDNFVWDPGLVWVFHFDHWTVGKYSTISTNLENFLWDPGLICSDFSILEDKDVLKGRDLSGSKGFEGILHFVLFIKLFSVFYNYDITNFLMMS